MDGWTVAWLMWIALFLAIEGAAIFNRERGDTLSEKIWLWFAIKNKPRGYKMRRFVLLIFLVWLTAHFLTGGWV
jgi:hypothetical protein